MQKKLRSLFLYEPDTIIRKAIAVALVDLFEEIRIVESNIETIKVINEKKFSVYIIGLQNLDSEKINLLEEIRRININAFIITVKAEYSPDELSILKKIRIDVLTEKPFSLNRISSEIEKHISRTNNEVITK